LLEHGGRLRRAVVEFGIPHTQWLDLSAALAPNPWPLPPIALEAWARLPEEEDGLAEVAAACYGARHALPVAGSQAAIQLLPRLLPKQRVAVLAPCYAEHAHAWRSSDQLQALSARQIEAQLDHLDGVVLANPNNPSGEHFTAERLLAWHARLRRRGGWLLVDEAFADCTPALSLAAHSHLPGLIVLRSFGKFFGLAGVRLGFVLAAPALLTALQEQLGPWPVSGPARALGLQALSARMASTRATRRQQLLAQGARLSQLLIAAGLPVLGGCALFQTCQAADAQALYQGCAQRGVLLRCFTDEGLIRVALPPTPAAWQRLEHTLRELA
jgi:cobalamin biosynthetic protein CobC